MNRPIIAGRPSAGMPSYGFACEVADDRAHGHDARVLTKAYYQPSGFSYSLAEGCSRVATADATRHIPVAPSDPPVFTGTLPCAAAEGEP